ncbi:MAG: class III poly(R)-hydroxyalkanoic acid synthase subunit PhaC [Candidatus Dadabacteria bacterium]|nr:class III poly(R)-hydroxyalkanoic acid synthase subunit PhaC [Candidatus Dadabacteria bacterium]
MSESLRVKAQRLLEAIKLGMGEQPEVKVGTTPHEVVFTENKLRLLHYIPVAEKVLPTPLVMVFALVNRPYILDLQPGRSVVEVLLKGGIDVYMIDWGIPGDEDKHQNLDFYINKYMRGVVKRVRKISNSDKVSILGYCMGGTMSVIYTALHPEDVKNLVIMATGIDFKASKEGLLNLWGDKSYFNVDKFVDAYGNAPAEYLQSIFLFMKPIENLVTKYVTFYERLDDKKLVENFLAMEKWLNDNIPVPGEVFREFIKYCYQENLLVENKLKIKGRIVDLRKIKCPVLNLIAEKDHLVPPSTSIVLENLISSKDKETIIFPSGHIGLSVSSKALKELWPSVAGWLAKRSK